MNKTWRDSSDDGWSCPPGDELAISCQQKTPITIRELHSLKNCCYFHHFDNTKRESRCEWDCLGYREGRVGLSRGLNDKFWIHENIVSIGCRSEYMCWVRNLFLLLKNFHLQEKKGCAQSQRRDDLTLKTGVGFPKQYASPTFYQLLIFVFHLLFCSLFCPLCTSFPSVLLRV